MKINPEATLRFAVLVLPIMSVPLLAGSAALGQGQNPPASSPQAQEGTRVPVTFSGGYQTDPRDGGRPVVLIAAALGVSSEVFRAAFRNVTPASGGREPEPGQVRQNKQALMQALGRYGVTNERLDTVSNFYRYAGSRGEMWRNTPATAYATVRNGAVVGFTVTNPGAGYSSPPQISLQGMPGLRATATVAYNTDFSRNGSVTSIALGGADPAPNGDARPGGRQGGPGGPGGPGGRRRPGGPGAPPPPPGPPPAR